MRAWPFQGDIQFCCDIDCTGKAAESPRVLVCRICILAAWLPSLNIPEERGREGEGDREREGERERGRRNEASQLSSQIRFRGEAASRI